MRGGEKEKALCEGQQQNTGTELDGSTVGGCVHTTGLAFSSMAHSLFHGGGGGGALKGCHARILARSNPPHACTRLATSWPWTWANGSPRTRGK